MQIPIWSRLSRHSAISRRQHALDKATAELDQKRRDVESEVRRAIQTANNNYLKAQADEMNSLFKYLIKQAVVRYYNGVEYVNQ